MLKHKINDYFNKRYFSDTLLTHKFDSKSCEMIAKELISKFNLSRCEVSEDNENGAIVTVLPQQ